MNRDARRVGSTVGGTSERDGKMFQGVALVVGREDERRVKKNQGGGRRVEKEELDGAQGGLRGLSTPVEWPAR